MADIDELAATPAGDRRQLRPVERATVRRVAADGRVRVTIDRLGDRREIAAAYAPQIDVVDGGAVTVDPPAGTRCVVLLPGRGLGGAVAVFDHRYVEG